MKLQLAELTLEKKEGNEQTTLQRLKVSYIHPFAKAYLLIHSRTYDLFCTNIDR